MIAIDIAGMPVSEKLKLMEALWDSLSAPPDGSFESPAWHESAWRQTEEELAAGAVRFVDWAEAKEQLRRYGRT